MGCRGNSTLFLAGSIFGWRSWVKYLVGIRITRRRLGIAASATTATTATAATAASARFSFGPSLIIIIVTVAAFLGRRWSSGATWAEDCIEFFAEISHVGHVAFGRLLLFEVDRILLVFVEFRSFGFVGAVRQVVLAGDQPLWMRFVLTAVPLKKHW